MRLTITWADVEGLRRFDNALKALDSKQLSYVANRAINRTGDTARSRVASALSKQTGLQRSYVFRKLTKGTKRSTRATLRYTMSAGGGFISLKWFQPRETLKGVSAAPRGQRRVFLHTFMKGGRFPARRDLGMSGQVWMPNLGDPRWGRSFDKELSDVRFPDEMVTGIAEKAFNDATRDVLPKRIEHEITRLTKGAFS